MSDFLCKIWNFFSNLLSGILDIIMEIVKTLADIIVDIAEGVVDALFGSGSLLFLAAVGLGLYFLLRKEEEPERNNDRRLTNG